MHGFVIVLSLFSSIYADRRCLLHKGTCVSHCPRGMHAYHTRCDGQTMSQRTCDSPSVVVLGYTCGWSRCDCNGHLLLDEQADACVSEYDCQTFSTRGPKSRNRSGRRRDGKRRYHLSRKIKIKEEDFNDQD